MNDVCLRMQQVLSAHFRAYIQALEKLQLDIASSSDLIGIEARSSGLFSTRREPLKHRSSVFAVGDRINILKVSVTFISTIFPVLIPFSLHLCFFGFAATFYFDLFLQSVLASHFVYHGSHYTHPQFNFLQW